MIGQKFTSAPLPQRSWNQGGQQTMRIMQSGSTKRIGSAPACRCPISPASSSYQYDIRRTGGLARKPG